MQNDFDEVQGTKGLGEVLQSFVHEYFSKQGARKALCVGFEKYDNEYNRALKVYNGKTYRPKSKNLKSATHDVHAVAGKLAKNAEGDNFTVHCILDDDNVNKEFYTQCNRSKRQTWLDLLKQELKWLFKGNNNSDILLFYFSGHGDSLAGVSHLSLPATNTEFLYYSLNDLLELANHSKFRHLIIILDCCQAGGIADLENYKNLKKNVTILTAGQARRDVSATSFSIASAKTQKAWYLPENVNEFSEYRIPVGRNKPTVQTNYSNFTGFLIEGLVGGAADPLGIITTTSLYQYISEGMWSAVKNKLYTGCNDVRPLLITNTDEAVPLKFVSFYLNDKDMVLLHDKFVMEQGIENLPDDMSEAVKKEVIMLKSEADLDANNSNSIKKMIQLHLVEGQRVKDKNGVDVLFYRLTARGKHYWDMIDCLIESYKLLQHQA